MPGHIVVILSLGAVAFVLSCVSSVELPQKYGRCRVACFKLYYKQSHIFLCFFYAR